MQLNEPLWTRIASSVAELPERVQRDARLSNRIRKSTCVTLAPIRDGAVGVPTTVLARNLSPTGISFMSSAELAVGQEFILWLSAGETTPIVIRCRVVWRDILSRTSSIIGATFLRPATEAEAVQNIPAETTVPDAQVVAESNPVAATEV
jgi:hypothetical protein